jgi:hypothetical protein
MALQKVHPVREKTVISMRLSRAISRRGLRGADDAPLHPGYDFRHSLREFTTMLLHRARHSDSVGRVRRTTRVAAVGEAQPTVVQRTEPPFIKPHPRYVSSAVHL